MAELALILAMDNKNGISKEGKIPWSIKEDMNYFQDVTKREYVKGKKNALIMGRHTFLQTGPLKDRTIIVVTSQDVLECDYKFKTLDESINYSKTLDLGKIFICGGKRIYEESLKHDISECYITRIDKDYECDNILSNNIFSLLRNITRKKYHLFRIEGIDVIFEEYCKSNIQNCEETQYLYLLDEILREGHFRQTRNSKTWSLFGKSLTFDLQKGFPLLTTKKVFFRGVVEELLFFLRGETNTKKLSEKGVKIWEPNTSKDFLAKQNLEYQEGDMGPMYGFNLVHFGETYRGMDQSYNGYNQIEYCLNLLKTDPFSRRIIMTTFNPAQAKEGVLYPCHGISIMFNVDEDWRLSCIMFQRSADACCGIPFNIASYALLIHLFCEVINNDSSYTGHKFTPGKLIMNFGDVHIYEEHYSGAIRQILRNPYPFPNLKINRIVKDLTEFNFEDFELIDYQCYTGINFKMIA